MFDLVLACFIGIGIGTCTGMVPGIHVNTAGAIMFASSVYLLNYISAEFLCVIFVSMSIAHALIEFVPSMLLGVPEEGTATSILPGHRMVLEGRSKEAIRIVSVGGFGAILVVIIMMPIFAVALPFLQGISKPYTWIILTVVSIYMIHRLSNGNVAFLWSLLLFILSGILGWIMLQTPISSGISLMCTFTGLFGISTILFSLNDSSSIPHQSKYYDLEIDRDAIKSIFAGGTAGAILGFLPGFGPAQGSIIAQGACGTSDESDDTKNFLLANSGLNTSDTLFSLIAIYLIGNPRSGIAVYMSYLISEFTLSHLMIFTFLMQGIDYRKLSLAVILLMIAILYAFAIIYKGPILYLTLALITTTAMGLLPHYLGVSKSHLMGVLILPAIIIYMQMYI